MEGLLKENCTKSAGLLNKEYKIYPITWDKFFEKEIETIYQMYKDQEHRIFSLDIYSNGGTVMDIIQDTIENDRVFVIKDNDNIVATFTLEDAIMFGDIITEMKIHIAIRRKYWGKESREICGAIRDYLFKWYKFKKIIAEVPQCKYGVIKLLKDMGLKHEGTLKSCLLYLDKNNNPKWYDKLIYTLTNEEI